MMKCELCRTNQASVSKSYFTSTPLYLCQSCYQAAEAKKHQPYSKVMESIAIAGSGYRINAKFARLGRA